MALRNYYAILGVSRHETTSGIRTAFRSLAKRYHPDHAGAGSTPAFLLIQEAYGVLADSAARASYDARLSSESASARLRADSDAASRPKTGPVPQVAVRRWPEPEPLVPERRMAVRVFSPWPSREAVYRFWRDVIEQERTIRVSVPPRRR